MRHGFFHHLSRLEHKGQDQLPCAKAVTDLFHCRQQDGIENLHSRLALGLLGVLCQYRINIFLNAKLLPAQDAFSQPLARA